MEIKPRAMAIAGALELFFWAFAPFQQFTGEVTGEPVPVFQRTYLRKIKTVLRKIRAGERVCSVESKTTQRRSANVPVPTSRSISGDSNYHPVCRPE